MTEMEANALKFGLERKSISIPFLKNHHGRTVHLNKQKDNITNIL
jgi:hypothetical protein